MITQLHALRESGLQYLDDPVLLPTHEFFRVLIDSAIADGQNLLIVIDDAHNAEGNESLGTVLSDLIESVGEWFQLLVFSRQPPLPTLYISAATTRLFLIDKKDFVVNQKEAVLLCHYINPSLTLEYIDSLLLCTEGRLVALMLSAHHFSPTVTQSHTVPSVSHFLKYRVLSLYNEGTLDLLQLVSVMPVISHKICES